MKRYPLSGPRWALLSAFLFLGLASAEAQLRPVPVRKSKADRERSSLVQEEGAVYLEGLIKKEIKARVTQPAPVYANLSGDRWLGNLLPKQEVVLLAISEKAYRVRGQAQQGQVAGWIGKAMVEGVNPDLVANLTKLHERQLLVDDLIENQQVALGLTVEEVIASLGESDRRNSKVDKEGRSDTLEYIKYQKVPQTQTSIDPYGRPFQSVTYVLVESGKATIGFEKGVVASIEESEGVNLQSGAVRFVPPPIILY